MDNVELSEMLIRLDERTKMIEKKVDSIAAEAGNTGWKRCVKQDDRISTLENKFETKHEDEKWFKRVTIGTLLGLILVRFWEFMSR